MELILAVSLAIADALCCCRLPNQHLVGGQFSFALPIHCAVTDNGINILHRDLTALR